MRGFLLLAAVMATLLLPGFSMAQGQQTRTITAEQMAGIILGQQDKVRIVLIYSSTCPACHVMFDDFVRWVSPYEKREDVAVFAFSTDRNAAALDRYLGDRVMPFERLQVEPWKPGDFDRALKPTGIDIGKRFGTPLLAVIDRNGKMVGQHEGSRAVKYGREWMLVTGIEKPAAKSFSWPF